MVAVDHLVLLFISLLSAVAALDDIKVGTRLLRNKVQPRSSFLQQKGSVVVDSQLDFAAQIAAQKKKDSVRRNEQLEDWKDGHQRVQSTLSPKELDQMSAGISKDTYQATLNSFLDASGKSRYVKDEGNQLAAKYLATKFQAAGFTVSFIPEGKPGLRNVVAFKKGSELGHETALFGAHYDSVNYKTPGVDAPGVDDNGSGTACLLSIAEALKGHTPKRSIALVGFNSEEEGLLGSHAFVQSVVEKKEHPELGDIKAAIIADEVAFPGRKQFSNQAIFETVGTVGGVQSLIDTFAHSVNESDGSTVSGFSVNNWGFGSDHMSFLNAGIPAMLLIERDDEWHADEFAHSSQDVFQPSEVGALSMDYGARMTRLGLRSFAQLANPATAKPQ